MRHIRCVEWEGSVQMDQLGGSTHTPTVEREFVDPVELREMDYRHG